MQTPWIEADRLTRSLERNEAFWEGKLGEPLLWITAPDAKPGNTPPEPATEEALWTDVDYVIATAEDALARTCYVGDALPVYAPWLGPDQYAGWLGADLNLKPRLFTSWVSPFVKDWSDHPVFEIDPENRWWKLYLEILHRSAEAGRDKWVTAYPDLHTGIDGLSAIRGNEELLIDLLDNPQAVRKAMLQMTAHFKKIVDIVSDVILPYGQGTSNWTMGWSAKRFICLGQNDFTCMISPEMFEDFVFQDTKESCEYMDYSIYHLDGPGAIRHVPRLLEIDSLDCIQWIHGAGQPPASHWLGLLRQIQKAGKSVQVFYGPSHTDGADLDEEMKILYRELDTTRLFYWAIVDSAEQAEHLHSLSEKILGHKVPSS